MRFAAAALDAGPQPGDREPAPGELALVQAFLNSHWDLEDDFGADLFATPESLRDWLLRRDLVERGARVSRRDHSAALTVRNGLRALLIANNGGPLDERAVAALDGEARTAPLGVELGGGEPSFVPLPGRLDGALSLVLSIVARSMLDGSWPRFKACRDDHCRWAFYDHSRNGASSWCSMAVCGGRAKQRAYYRRTR